VAAVNVGLSVVIAVSPLSITMLNFAERGTCILILLLLLYQAAFPEHFKLSLCVYIEIVISECPSRAIIYNSGPVEGLSLGTIARDGNCQIFPLSFQWSFCC
jgi:hypothetical protein